MINAVENRKLEMWWFSLMHPAYQSLALEPAFQEAIQELDSYMADQRVQFRAIESEGGS